MAYKKSKKELNWKYISLFLIGIFVGVGIGLLLQKFNDKKAEKLEQLNTPIYTSIENVEEKNKVAKEIISAIDKVTNQNIAFNVQVGESSYDCYIYNKDGECIVQASDGSYVTVFTKDGNSVKNLVSSDSVVLNASIDLLDNCRKAVELLEKGTDGISLDKVTYENNTSTEIAGINTSDVVKIKEYVITVKGYDNVKYLYSSIGEEYAKSMVDSLQEYMGKDWIPELQFGYVYTLEGEIGFYCSTVQDGDSYLNWVCEGPISFVDWKLGDKWYTTEFKADNSQVLYDLMQEELSSLEKKLESMKSE